MEINVVAKSTLGGGEWQGLLVEVVDRPVLTVAAVVALRGLQVMPLFCCRFFFSRLDTCCFDCIPQWCRTSLFSGPVLQNDSKPFENFPKIVKILKKKKKDLKAMW